MSPISSSSTVPFCASSKEPARRSSAPVKAPFSWPKSSLSRRPADSAAQLTSLFEWAKFSQHDPQPEMRDAAIAALVAVRDELAREPVTV